MNSDTRKLISISKTSKILYSCLKCEKLSVYYSRGGDGKTCAHCGGSITPLGYAKNEVVVSKTKKKTPITASESEDQIGLFEWAAYAVKTHPDLEWLYHIPNGGKRSITTAKRLKAEGVKAGVPDVCLPVPKGRYHGLYIELKAGKNMTTDNQDRWLDGLTANGYFTAVCYGWEAATKIITDYLRGGGDGVVR